MLHPVAKCLLEINVLTRGTIILAVFLQLCTILDSMDLESYAEPIVEKRNSQAEVRALFINCRVDENPDSIHDSEISRFQREELFKYDTLHDCRKKLAVTLKLTANSDDAGEEYIPIEHVFDGPSSKRLRLLDPYVLRLRREPAVQAYKLRQIDTVRVLLTNRKEDPPMRTIKQRNNAQVQSKLNRKRRFVASIPWQLPESQAADVGNCVQYAPFKLDHEDPYHKSYSIKLNDINFNEKNPVTLRNHDSNERAKDCGLRLFTANESLSTPIKTGVPKHDFVYYGTNRTIKNQKMHKKRLKSISHRDHSAIQHRLLNELLPSVRNKRHEYNIIVEDSSNNQDQSRSRAEENQFMNKTLDNTELFLNKNSAAKNPFTKTNIANDYVSLENALGVDSNQDDNKYLKEILQNDNKFSLNNNPGKRGDTEVNNINENKDMLYSLYEVGNADLWHTVQFQLLQKSTNTEGTTIWNDITKGENINVGAANAEWVGGDVAVRYRPVDWLNRSQFTLPVDSLSLLKKMDPTSSKIDEGLPTNEYIVVPTEDIMLTDSEFNKNEENAKSEESLSDNHKRHRRVVVHVGRAWTSNDKKMNIVTRGTEDYLTVPHQCPLQAQIDIEARADNNEVVRVGSSARITTIVSDSTRRIRTILTIQATNTGLAASHFRATVRDCSAELSTLLGDGGSDVVATSPVLLPPRHTKRMILELPVEMPIDSTHCTVALLNNNGDAVAVRDVAIKKRDRCFCVWHCKCVCLGLDPKLMCSEMSYSKLIAAGLSSRERPRRERSICCPDSSSINMIIMVLGVLALLLCLGFIKACLGVIVRRIGILGLDRVVKMPRQIDYYHEPWLRMRRVIYDGEGWPLHPDTKQRTVRVMSMSMEFLLNTVFFIMLPCITLRSALAQLRSKYNPNKKTKKERVLSPKNCFKKNSSKYEKFGSSTKNEKEKKKKANKKIKGNKVEPKTTLKNISIRLRRHRKQLQQWMTPDAEDLSTDLWNQENQGITQKPLKPCFCPCDSDKDDTQYVITQMERSRESLAKNQQVPLIPNPKIKLKKGFSKQDISK